MKRRRRYVSDDTWNHAQRCDRQGVDGAKQLARTLRRSFLLRRRCSLGRNRHRALQGRCHRRNYPGRACGEEQARQSFSLTSIHVPEALPFVICCNFHDVIYCGTNLQYQRTSLRTGRGTRRATSDGPRPRKWDGLRRNDRKKGDKRKKQRSRISQ